MLVEVCSQERSYLRFYGLLGQVRYSQYTLLVHHQIYQYTWHVYHQIYQYTWLILGLPCTCTGSTVHHSTLWVCIDFFSTAILSAEPNLGGNV